MASNNETAKIFCLKFGHATELSSDGKFKRCSNCGEIFPVLQNAASQQEVGK
jgi:NADH pyrophosphatase NudC (nudix superfamily)